MLHLAAVHDAIDHLDQGAFDQSVVARAQDQSLESEAREENEVAGQIHIARDDQTGFEKRCERVVVDHEVPAARGDRRKEEAPRGAGLGLQLDEIATTGSDEADTGAGDRSAAAGEADASSKRHPLLEHDHQVGARRQVFEAAGGVPRSGGDDVVEGAPGVRRAGKLQSGATAARRDFPDRS